MTWKDVVKASSSEWLQFFWNICVSEICFTLANCAFLQNFIKHESCQQLFLHFYGINQDLRIFSLRTFQLSRSVFKMWSRLPFIGLHKAISLWYILKFCIRNYLDILHIYQKRCRARRPTTDVILLHVVCRNFCSN